MIATWAGRYLPARANLASQTPAATPNDVVVDEVDGLEGYAHLRRLGAPHLVSRRAAEVGGADTGPGPYDVLLSALGACTSMTMRMYARRKGWDYGPSTSDTPPRTIHASDCESCETRQDTSTR